MFSYKSYSHNQYQKHGLHQMHIYFCGLQESKQYPILWVIQNLVTQFLSSFYYCFNICFLVFVRRNFGGRCHSQLLIDFVVVCLFIYQ